MYENAVHVKRKVNKSINLRKIKKIIEDKKRLQEKQSQPEEHMYTHVKIMEFLAN